MRVFDEKFVNERRQYAADFLNVGLGDEDLVLFFGGGPIQKPGGLDQNYFYLPHPEYYWLTGLRRPSGVLAYSKRFGWIDFILPLKDEERIWEGVTDNSVFDSIIAFHQFSKFLSLQHSKSNQGTIALSVQDLSIWLDSNHFSRIFSFGQAPDVFSSRTEISVSEFNFLQEQLNKSRRPKDSAEIDLVRKAAICAASGYSRISEYIRPGVTERQIQLEYESAVQWAGGEKLPYDTIVGSGSRSAVLHALPSENKVRPGDFILVDGGADINDYCVDITRVYAANKKWSIQQKNIFDIVLEAQTNSIAQCSVGTEWHHIHRTSARTIAEGLKSLSILKGEIDSLLEGAISLFFPHGVGHMVGHRVRDVGRDINKISEKCCGVSVRVDFKLEENFLMTVEPGLYFIEPLLNLQANRELYKHQVNWSELEKWKDFGGIRLEDDILITKSGPENLTEFIPKI